MKTKTKNILDRLKMALSSGDPDSVAHIIKELCSSRRYRRIRADILTSAASDGENEIISLLLDGGVPVDLADSNGFIALEVASHRGRTSTVMLLLARGATPSRSSRKAGCPSALMLAAFKGDVDLVALMLEHGANVEDICRLPEASLLRIPGRVLRRVKDAGGVFPAGINQLLQDRQALGDQNE